jgi:MoxR-like ATPase
MTSDPMTDEPVPFELIAELPPDQKPETHDAEARRRLLSRRHLPAFVGDPENTALRYCPSRELLLAINMALHTGSPLLLTGEAGTGKTRAADFVGAYFGIPVYPFVVKSTSVAQDLMYELDRHSFPHPFVHELTIKPESGRPPIVIVTSNEERRLPDAFLRRCIFHRIVLTPELIQAAVESMAGEGEHASFPRLDKTVRDLARKRFWEIREKAGLEKPPTTAELLTWLSILSAKGVDEPH